MNATDKHSGKNGTKARDGKGRFTQGNPGGPGRSRGSINKISASLKDEIREAYRLRGGIKWLKKLSDREFIRLLEKVMPKEIAADVKMRAQGEGNLDFDTMTEAQLEREGHAAGMKIRRVNGKVWFYEDADATLELHDARNIVDRAAGAHLRPVAAECLQNAIAALRKHLPALTALLPKAEATLAARGESRDD